MTDAPDSRARRTARTITPAAEASGTSTERQIPMSDNRTKVRILSHPRFTGGRVFNTPDGPAVPGDVVEVVTQDVARLVQLGHVEVVPPDVPPAVVSPTVPCEVLGRYRGMLYEQDGVTYAFGERVEVPRERVEELVRMQWVRRLDDEAAA